MLVSWLYTRFVAGVAHGIHIKIICACFRVFNFSRDARYVLPLRSRSFDYYVFFYDFGLSCCDFLGGDNATPDIGELYYSQSLFADVLPFAAPGPNLCGVVFCTVGGYVAERSGCGGVLFSVRSLLMMMLMLDATAVLLCFYFITCLRLSSGVGRALGQDQSVGMGNRAGASIHILRAGCIVFGRAGPASGQGRRAHPYAAC